MSDFWNQISPSEGAVPLSVVASRSQDVVASVVRKASVSRADAETIQGRVEKRYGAGDGTGWDGPKLLEDWDWVGDPAPYSLVWEEGPDDWAFEDWDAGLNVYVEPITSWALGIYPSGKTASEENTCRNCDKPTSGEYCSNACEDSDRFPAAQDDQEKFTKGSSRKTAETDYDQIDFDANRAYWSGQARAAEEQKAAERRLWDMKGQEVTVVKGRKIPIGTTGIVFYSGEGQWGWRIGFTTPSGEEMWTSLQNVELTSELSSTSARKTAEVALTGLVPNSWYVTDRRGDITAGPIGNREQAQRMLSLDPEFARIFQTDADGNGTVNANPKAQVYYSTRKTAGPMGINVGDIFYNSWGYDQTNVDFYEVVRTTEKMVEIKPIQSRVVEGGAYSQSVEPVRGSYRDYDVIIDTGRSSPYGQPERQTKMCRVRDGYQGGPTVVLSDSHSAYPYKGGSLSESGPYGGH